MRRAGTTVLTGPAPGRTTGDDVAIDIDAVSVSYSGAKAGRSSLALDDVSFAVRRGEFLVLLGPSGCGKSTLLKVIADLLAPSRGLVQVHGAAGDENRVGFVFQSDALLPWRTALQNVTLAVELSHTGSRKEATERGRALMEELGLADACDKFPSQLSGGMRKRVALARAFAYRPAVFLMDEPFGALDAQTRIKVGNFLLSLLGDAAQTTVFVTHDIDEAVALADRIVVMSASPGRIAGVVDVPLRKPRDYYQTRFEDGFREVQRTVWELLGGETRHD
jgi:NitT/TauT family transport system ATP-binding protein